MSKHHALTRLASTLSRAVLSRDTIIRHARSTLAQPELLEIPAEASALNLWFAVLHRAEQEQRVSAVVDAVLEENPGCQPVATALEQWRAALDTPATEGSTLLPQERLVHPSRPLSTRVGLALAVTLLAGIVINHQEVFRLWERLSQRPEPTESELKQAFTECWANTGGAKDGQREHSIIAFVSTRDHEPTGAEGGSHQHRSRSTAYRDNPLFQRCAQTALSEVAGRMTAGRTLGVELVLAGIAQFPTENQARADLQECWRNTEGSLPGQPPFGLDFDASYGGGGFSPHGDVKLVPGFLQCARKLYRAYSDRAHELNSLQLLNLQFVSAAAEADSPPTVAQPPPSIPPATKSQREN